MNNHTIFDDICQDVLEIPESTTRVVRDMCTLYKFSTDANRCLGLERVSNLDYQKIPG